MQTAIESETTARVIESYLVEHLFESAGDAAPAATPIRFQPLRVGPFRFLCPADAVALAPPGEAASLVLEAADLVPPAHRARLSGATTGGLTVWLDGGRLEVRGCSLEPAFALDGAAVVARQTRGDTPWIAGSVREPPAFVLEPQALGAPSH